MSCSTYHWHGLAEIAKSKSFGEKIRDQDYHIVLFHHTVVR